MERITSVYELKAAHEAKHKGSHFFDEDTLKFFGETYGNMHLFKRTVVIKDSYRNDHECYILSTLQKNAPCGAQRSYHHFDVKTLEVI